MSGRNYYQNQYEGNGREDENVVKFGVDKSEDRLKRAEMKQQIDALFASHYGPGAQNSQARGTQNCQAQDAGHSRGHCARVLRGWRHRMIQVTPWWFPVKQEDLWPGVVTMTIN